MLKSAQGGRLYFELSRGSFSLHVPSSLQSCLLGVDSGSL